MICELQVAGTQPDSLLLTTLSVESRRMATNLQSIIVRIPGSEDSGTDCETRSEILPPAADFQHKLVLFRVFSSVKSGSTGTDIRFSVPI